MKNGVFGYIKGLDPHGIPMWLLPIMIPVELLGLFTKPFALAIRLFANMTAGHIVILALLGLIFILHTYVVVPVSVSFALFIFFIGNTCCASSSVYFYNAFRFIYRNGCTSRTLILLTVIKE